jgi:protein O-GlcNAc transferase
MSDSLEQAAIWLQQALSYQQDGDLQAAERLYRRVLVADPANTDAMNLLAVIHHEHGNRELAIRMLQAAVKLKPETGPYWNNLAVVLSKHGERISSIAALRHAIQYNPRDHNCHQALIFAMDLHPESTADVRMADRRAFNANFCAALTARAAPHANVPDPDRILRVGYVSGDYRQHSAAMVVEPILEHHDPEQVAVHLYSNYPGTDPVTERIKGYGHVWRDVSTLNDDQFAAQIREDGIDVLVDLSGYSGGNRLLAFARKPAPVQITAWGHATGTGLDCMDILFADAVTIPPEHEPMYRERILWLPCILSYRPPDDAPPVAPPPAERNGYISFGYLGRANKTHEETWATWAEILHRVPHSRLILKSDDYKDTAVRELVSDYLISLRIGTGRFEFRGMTDNPSHMASYSDVDISLDSWPQSGGVTVLESCLMGVPTVTRLGSFANGRVGASILAHLQQDLGIALDRPSYVSLAVAMAGLTRTLGDRLALRDRLLGSVICDGPAYTQHVETLYRHAWRTWIEVQPAAVSQNGALVGV